MIDAIELTSEQKLIRKEVQNLAEDFGDEYWREKDMNEEYPHEFAEVLAEHGWLGALIPEEYGGAGMGTEELIVFGEELAASGAGWGGAQTIHGALYTSTPIVKYGSAELKERFLPDLASGEKTLQSFGLTEPNAGSESTAIETQAESNGDEYVVNGQKIWTSRADVTDYLLLVARTTPREEVDSKTAGISLFIVDVQQGLEDGTIEMSSIPKMSLTQSHSFEIWFKDHRIPAENLVGEEDGGFYHVLDGLNDERLMIAAELVGTGNVALEKAVDYANEREVFDRKIGKNQAIQHPLAAAYAQLQGARQVVYNAARMSDDLQQRDVGILANTAKYLAAEAAFDATDAAVQTHGGFGVAKEYDVERYFRNARVARIVPVSQELALNYLGENALGLPRSY